MAVPVANENRDTPTWIKMAENIKNTTSYSFREFSLFFSERLQYVWGSPVFLVETVFHYLIVLPLYLLLNMVWHFYELHYIFGWLQSLSARDPKCSLFLDAILNIFLYSLVWNTLWVIGIQIFNGSVLTKSFRLYLNYRNCTSFCTRQGV